jgi:hypothetical protein
MHGSRSSIAQRDLIAALKVNKQFVKPASFNLTSVNRRLLDTQF